MKKKWIILAIVSVGMLLISLDMTVLYTTLPTLSYELGASSSEKLWIVNAYPLVMAGLLLGIGALGDRLGHRNIFMSGLLVFGLASLMAALSPTPIILIIARIILAVGAAMMMPATLSLIRINFLDTRERNIAIAVWASVFSGGAGLGPILGGLLLEYFYWGSVFLINVPIIIISFIMSIIFIPKDVGFSTKKWDFFGSLQIMIGLIGLIFAIKEFTRVDSSFLIALATLIIGVIFLIWFVKRQKRLGAPLIDFALFKNLSFSAGVVTALLTSFILVGTQLVITQRYQLFLGYTPLEAGLYMAAIPVMSFVAGIVMGRHLYKFNIINVQLTSLFSSGLGLTAFLMFFDSSSGLQILSLALIGTGLGIAGTSASNAIMNSAPIEKAGMAASTEELSYELGAVFGVGILGSLSSIFYTHFLNLPSTIDVPVIVKDSLDYALLISEELPPEVAFILENAAKTAFDQSFIAVMITAILFTLIGALFVFLAQKKSNL
ncbi:TPA: MFS transporter [Staphylococcus aureus]|nr:MFS transporter [Staphylococcus aureus]